jgi:biotin synthase-like enzyme
MIQKNVDVVLLTEPVPFAMRSNGGYRIASQIRSGGYSCQTFGYVRYFSFKQFKKLLKTAIGTDTKLLCISASFIYEEHFYAPEDQRKNMQEMREYIASRKEFYTQIINFAKERFPNIKVVLGGADLRILRDINTIDIVVNGYGDKAIVELLKFLDNKNPFFQFTRNNNKMIIDGDSLNNGFDFQSSQTIYHPTDYIQANEPLVIEVGRGCKFDCSFCSFRHVGKFDDSYLKHIASLREELLRNYHEHGTTNYIISDDTYNDNTFKLEQMAKLVQSLPFKFRFSAYLRIDLMRSHREQYQLLKDSGVAGVHFGIETLNHRAGKIIGKGLHPNKVIEELYRFRDHMPEVATWGSFIVGLPGDTKETVTEWAATIADPEFPLDTVAVKELSLMPQDLGNNSVEYASPDRLSEFSKNSKKYFTFTEEGVPEKWHLGSDHNWHNGSFDKIWAAQFAGNFHNQALVNNRQSMGGLYATLLTMLDVPIESAKKKWFDLNLDVDSLIQARLTSYTEKLMTK